MQVDHGSWESSATKPELNFKEEYEDFDDDPMDNDTELDLPETHGNSDTELVAGDEDWIPTSHFTKKPRVKKQEDKEWKCSECASVYLSQSDLKKHVRDCHTASRNQNSGNISDDNDSENDNNEGGTNTQLDIEELIRKINEDPTLTLKQMNINLRPSRSCDFCTKTFQKISTVETHVIKHHPDSLKEFLERYETIICPECEKVFLTQKRRNTHMKTAHRKASRSASFQNFKKTESTKASEKECPYCRKCFIKNEDYISHIVTHERGPKGLRCEQCDFKTGTVESLKKHIVQLHLNKDILCPDCGECCIDGQAFKDHKKKYHTKSYKTKSDKTGKVRGLYKKREKGNTLPTRLICEMCSKTFGTKMGLKLHMKTIHSGTDQIYECSECGKKSSSISAHTRHISLHMPPTVPCPQCDTKVRSKEFLKRHILSHHTAEEDLKIRCDQCGKGFKSQIILDGHMNMHLGLKPYKCRWVCWYQT